jgi:hypothetical protein
MVRECNERRAGRKAKIKVLIFNYDFCRLEEGGLSLSKASLYRE